MLSPSAHPSGFIEPCLPTLSRTVPDGPRWAFEVKHDGYRFIARRDGDRVRVFSRHGKDWTDKVPAIVEAMLALPVKTAILDGDGETIFRHACGFGAEGIVAKRRDRPYRSGRSADWLKIKNPLAPAATRVMDKGSPECTPIFS
jgi:ATP-dependent DNA ligase